MVSIEPSRRESNGAGDVSDVALEQQAAQPAILDRVHVLARIALILDRHNIRLHRAKINTLGSRAEDIFWISGAALAQPEQTEALRSALLKD